jgi:xanthine/uracil/vitamin C permease (AzgA family)
MGDLFGVEPMLAIGGLAIIAALHFRNVKGSIIVGVLATALGYFAINSSWPTRYAQTFCHGFFVAINSSWLTRGCRRGAVVLTCWAQTSAMSVAVGAKGGHVAAVQRRCPAAETLGSNTTCPCKALSLPEDF